MSEFTEADLQGIGDACRENAALLAESWNQCFGRSDTLRYADPRPWNPEEIPADWNGPGLQVLIEVGDEGILCLIPDSGSLPDWYRSPGESEQARLQTLAMEWSLNLLPENLEAGQSKTISVEDLAESMRNCEPAETALVFELQIRTSSSDDSESAAGSEAEAEPNADSPEEEGADDDSTDMRISIVCPVRQLKFADDPEPGDPQESAAQPATDMFSNPSEPAVAAPSMVQISGLGRLLPMSVNVSVRVAEKKIDLGQLLKIAPGALIKFNKSCEELLDLYVNNTHYCRGEAVKIGENFGLKVKDVGVVEKRAERILYD